MAPLATERQRAQRTGDIHSVPVKAVSQIFQGGMVVLLAGAAIAGRIATTRTELSTMMVIGVALSSFLGGAADGDVKAQVSQGIHRFANSAGGDAITVADKGKLAFLVDDQTVAKTIGGGARPIVGEVVDVDSEGVWIDFRKAREPRRAYLPFAINETDTLAATSAELVSPVVGAITSMSTIVQKAVTTGGDVTALVAAVAVVGLACTIADAATKGTVVSDTPTIGDATTVVAAGDRIQVAPAAAFATAGAVSGFVEITY